jgi:hypothetical protein
VIQEDDVMPADFVVGNVAVFLSQVLKQQDRIRRAELAERKPEEVPLETGREAVLGGPGRFVSGGSCHLQLVYVDRWIV